MGSHRYSGSSDKPAGPRTTALRVLAVCVLAWAVAIGISVETPPGSTLAAVPAAGQVAGAAGFAFVPVTNPDSLEAGSGSRDGLSAAAGSSIAAAPTTLVSFVRTAVRAVARDRLPTLNVARAGLKRPPAGFLVSPLEALRASSPYGYRVSPISGAAGDFHLGQDFAAACGTRVYAADAGVVLAAGWHPWGGGNRVEVDHGNGLITTYNHLEAIGVKAGQAVEVGQVIARVGTTGWSTGCHLHFETILDGRHVDPQRWTLIPLQQLDRVESIDMVDFGVDRTTRTPVYWSIPADHQHHHSVVGGEQELPVEPAQDPGYSASTSVQPPAAPGTGTAQASEGTPTPPPASEPAQGTTAPAPTTPVSGSSAPAPANKLAQGTTASAPATPVSGSPAPPPATPAQGTTASAPVTPVSGSPAPAPTSTPPEIPPVPDFPTSTGTGTGTGIGTDTDGGTCTAPPSPVPVQAPANADTGTSTAPPSPLPAQAPADTTTTMPPVTAVAVPLEQAPAAPVPPATPTETAAEAPPSDPVVVPEVPSAILTENIPGPGDGSPAS